MVWSLSATASPIENLNKAGVILDGYDPVSYFKANAPTLGDAKIATEFEGVKYWFTTEANKTEFLKDPKKYQPAYGGWCAYAVADSKSKVEVDPKSFLIQDGRLLLFYKGLWGNTREKWLHSKEKNQTEFLKEADANWPSVKKEAP